MAFSRMLVLVLASLLLTSCQPRIPRSEFHEGPMRVLDVLLVLEKGVDPAGARALIREVNVTLTRQTGLALRPIALCTIRFPESRDRADMLNRMHTATRQVSGQFDLFIGFVGKTPAERVKRALIGDWLGVIDDTYRRYILLKEMDPRVLIHEVYHAFIESPDHSECGIMSTLIELFPGIALNYSMDLCEGDRALVMANRDRRFDGQPWPDSNGETGMIAAK
jgi:hypothetical protein